MTYEENYLAHYGINGQKWGIRRFQNEDGSLTEEGKLRYNKLSDKDKKIYSALKGAEEGTIHALNRNKEKLKKNPYWFALRRILLTNAIKANNRDLKQLREAMYKKLKDVGDVRVKDIDKPRKTLSQRFDDALKDNPKLTYKQIYKEMKVDMNSEDTDVYKEAEDKWFKKHGY